MTEIPEEYKVKITPPLLVASVADAPQTTLNDERERLTRRNMELRTTVRILTVDRDEWAELADHWATTHYELRAKIADLVAVIAPRGGDHE